MYAIKLPNKANATLGFLRRNLRSVKIGHHFGMHCHVSSDVDDIIYPANCVQIVFYLGLKRGMVFFF
jgi:hypothetical protein